MCTSLVFKTRDLYFGRNLDLEYTYDEAVTIMPRHYPLGFDRADIALSAHHAMIGMAYTVDDYPLYYDAVNEMGLGMAGLNFPGFAVYHSEKNDMRNILPCEFIPWVLAQCASVSQARQLIAETNLVDIAFSKALPNTPLHWMIAGHDGTIVVEPTQHGLTVFDAPTGVLTNSPPFDFHLLNLTRYMALSQDRPENRLSPQITLKPFSNGMGALGLPGDLSSPSRFVRASFANMNSVSGKSESESVNQFFHLLRYVEHPRGCVRMAKDKYEITQYSSCCNMDKGIYYYTTYENSRITAVHMHHENLDICGLIHFPLLKEWAICKSN